MITGGSGKLHQNFYQNLTSLSTLSSSAQPFVPQQKSSDFPSSLYKINSSKQSEQQDSHFRSIAICTTTAILTDDNIHTQEIAIQTIDKEKNVNNNTAFNFNSFQESCNLPCIPIRMAQLEINALIDSGSSVNIAKNFFYENIPRISYKFLARSVTLITINWNNNFAVCVKSRLKS